MHYLSLIVGVFLILLAVLANRLGIDHDSSWGLSRYLMFSAGLVLMIIGAMTQAIKMGLIPVSIRERVSTWVRAITGGFKKALRASWISYLFTVLIFLGLSVFVLWYTSNGQFPRFKSVTNPYADLGEAFLRGQVALLDIPDPRLVALENPYDFQQREKVPYNWDLTYYKGKYFIYWGPVPALVYAFVEWITQARPPDQLMVILSFIGLAAVVTALLIQTRKWYFPAAPGISLPFFLLAALMNMAYMFILAMPQVYETSIISGQFFLLFGVLAWLSYRNNKKAGWLPLAGLCWGLAIGSRYNLALSVGLFLTFELFQLWKENRKSRRMLQRAVAVLIPLALCGLGLALYNYARFQNPLETGLVYQLTVPVYQNRYFSALYVPANLYVYLLYPIKMQGSFPFIPSNLFQPAQLPSWAIVVQGKMFNEVNYGAFTSVPLTWLLALLAPFGIINTGWGYKSQKTLNPGRSQVSRQQIAWLFALAALLQFLFLLFYYFGAMRFTVDYYLLGFFALVFTAWELDEKLLRAPALRIVFWLIVMLLALLTAGAALVAGFDIPPQLLRAFNPSLYLKILRYGNLTYASLLHMRDSTSFLGTFLRFALHLVGLY